MATKHTAAHVTRTNQDRTPAPSPVATTDHLGADEAPKPTWHRLPLEQFVAPNPHDREAWMKDAAECDSMYQAQLLGFAATWKAKLAEVGQVIGGDRRLRQQFVKNVLRNAPRNRMGSWTVELERRLALAAALLGR